MISHARRHNQMSHWNRAAAVLSLCCPCWFAFRLSNPGFRFSLSFGSLAFSWKWGGILPVKPHFKPSLVLEFCAQPPLRDHQCLKDGSHGIFGSWQTVSPSWQLDARAFFLAFMQAFNLAAVSSVCPFLTWRGFSKWRLGHTPSILRVWTWWRCVSPLCALIRAARLNCKWNEGQSGALHVAEMCCY